VTDQSSQPQSLCGSLVPVGLEPPLATQAVPEPAPEKCREPQERSDILERVRSGMVVCIICGRSGRFINPFHPPG
jgi:hypothetical protein